MLPTRPLGSRGPQLTLIGLGGWALGGPSSVDSWGSQDDRASVATVQRALDEGVNWVDTAPAYGLGHSEQVIGQAIRGRREEVFVATKCTIRWSADGTTWRSGAPASVREECEQSLRRLAVDYVDLLQIHFPPDDASVEETWAALAALADEGKTRFIGVSNFDVELMRRCLAVRPVDSLQSPYSLIHREIEAEILPFCMEQGIGVIGFGALSQGILTGSFDVRRLEPSDFRHNQWMQQKLPMAQRVVDALRPMATARDVTVGQLAIAWAATRPEITGVIVGARSPDQVAANVAAAGLADARLAAEIEAALSGVRSAGTCAAPL